MLVQLTFYQINIKKMPTPKPEYPIDLICYECETDALSPELLRRMRLIERNTHGPHQYTVLPLEHCNNCMRSQRVRTKYSLWNRSKKSGSRFELSMVKSSDIRQTPSPLRHVASHRTYTDFYYLLCNECKMFLTRTSPMLDRKERRAIDEMRKSWDYIWPSYYWNLIKDCKLSPQKLLECIPQSHRLSWIPVIRGYYSFELMFHLALRDRRNTPRPISKCYANCTIHTVDESL